MTIQFTEPLRLRRVPSSRQRYCDILNIESCPLPSIVHGVLTHRLLVSDLQQLFASVTCQCSAWPSRESKVDVRESGLSHRSTLSAEAVRDRRRERDPAINVASTAAHMKHISKFARAGS